MSLSRDKVTKVPVWVKVHKVVPVVAYSEDGLSIIVTQLGKPIMLEAFTNAMCAEPWGRLGFARALIEVTAEKDLKQEVTMAIPIVDGEGHTMAKIDVAYEWKPASDGFTMVQNRKKKGKQVGNNQARLAKGFKVSKPSQVWNIKSTKKGSGTQKDDSSKLVNQNPFDVLNTVDNVKELGKTSGDKEAPKETKEKQTNLEYESEVEEMVVSENQLNVYVILESHVEINTVANVCNDPRERRVLWADLKLYKRVVSGLPWVLLGDFNVALNMKDIFMDIHSTVLHFTWNQKPRRRNGVLKKLDRIMGNLDFVDTYQGAYAIFQPYQISDHSPSVIKIPSLTCTKPRPFKFYNFLAHKGRFWELLNTHWNASIVGHSMFQELDEVQKALDRNPSNSDIHGEEAVYVQAFDESKIDEERFLRQKAKIDLLEGGDSNSTYFHKSIIATRNFHQSILCSNLLTYGMDWHGLEDGENLLSFAFYVSRFWDLPLLASVAILPKWGVTSIKSRNQRNRIDSVTNAANVEVTGSGVSDVFVSHYESFIGSILECDLLNTEGLFNKKVLDGLNMQIIRPITNAEIKTAMFDIGDDKAPGPDVYTSMFFKKGRDVVGADVCKAIHDLFSNGKLLKEINHTFMTLIPKIATPQKVNDYRPISCCNVIYKCISKIITNRIKEVVSENQSAFVPGKRISNNILLTQELMHNYHLKRGSPRCAFKVDIQKAYDTLIGDSWDLSLNDLFIFAHGDVDSAGVIMASLDEFRKVSGLVLSIPKSTAYFCNVLNHVKIAILNIMPFSEGELPLNYFGVPLISSRLLNRDCKVLVEKARNRIGDWKNKSLSFAGRLQLLFDAKRYSKGKWRATNGTMTDFSVKCAWEVLRPHGIEVPWLNTVWFSHAILRHAFHLCLVMRRSLKTQDKLRQWDVAPIADIT
ncbi:hypothetical protein Tco_0089618 [Tanacetum coccineum]